MERIVTKILLVMFMIALIWTVKEDSMADDEAKNVFGDPLQLCCQEPMTGFFRDGFCRTNAQDLGTHVVCAMVTDEFLQFSKRRGNDLITPKPEWQFPGLKAGDGWCLCAMRWLEAYEADVAPPVLLESTHEKALKYIPLHVLESHQLKGRAQ